MALGFLLWRSELRIQHCCSHGISHRCSADLIPALGTSIFCECWEKKEVFITSILMRSLERGDKTMRSTSLLIEETCPKSFSLSLLCLFLNIESVIFYFLFGG